MKNNMTKALGMGLLAGVAVTGTAEAQSNDSLIKTLVKKGMLTEAEAASLRNESANQEADAMAAWVESLSLKGDLRLRYDHTHDAPDSGGPAEDRWRYRFRFGGTANMQNGVKTGFRLATGDQDDIGSTNQTMDGSFDNDSIYLDQAWAQMEIGGVTVIGGKVPNFEKTGWKLSKALFDGDITPEGFEAHYSTTAGNFDVGFHGGAYFTSGENDSGNNINNLFLGQITASTSLSDNAKLDLGLGAYNIEDGDLTADANKRKGNNSNVGYSPVFLDAALSLKTGPGVKLYGTWVNNQESSATKDTGYIGGLKFGSAKTAGQWEAKFEYRSLEADAVWDELADSDFGAFGASAASGDANEFKSGTNVEGSILQGKYMIYDNVQAVLTFMFTESEDGVNNDQDNTRVQADLIFKF